MRRLLQVLQLFSLTLPVACSAEDTPAPAAAAPVQTAQAPAVAPRPASAPAAASGEKLYTVLREPQATSDPARIEVVEVFLYTCPHCYAFDPLVNAWHKKQPADVNFIRLPASFGPTGEVLARTYYTAEMLGVLDKMHPILFDAIHKQRRPLNNLDDVAKLFAENGVPEAEFRGTYGSFAVDGKFRRGQQLEVAYGVTGVPAMAVNGKYSVNISRAGGDGMLKVVDQLVAQERTAAR